MDKKTITPFYIKFSLTLLSLAILSIALHLGSAILLPLFFSILLAILLLPVTNFLQRKGANKVIAILLTLICAMAVIGSVIYFLSTQIGSFLEDIPTLKARLNEIGLDVRNWIQVNMNLTIRKQDIDETAEQMTQDSPGLVEQTVLTLKDIISYLVFLPVYTFLILYHKDMIKRFLTEVFKRSEKDAVTDVLYESQMISQQYVTGLLIELTIVFILNSAGFLIVGLKYPIFLALVAALLNIVPYIGMIIANIFCMMVTLVSGEQTTDIFIVFGVLASVQLIDNNILMPWVVGSKVKLNALAIILGVLTAGALCGIPGMFLAIPGLALMKVVCERVDGLKPWAILLGDETTIALEKKNVVKRTFERFRRKSKKPASTEARSGGQ